MQAVLSELNRTFAAEGRPTFEMRIGVESREVLVDQDRASTSHGLPRGRRTPRQEVRRAGLRGRRSRLDGAPDGTSERTSEPRPRIGGMLEDADLDGLLRFEGRADPDSSKRVIHPVPPCRGLDISWSVPSRLPLLERLRGDTLSACHDLEGT